ncbi:MAG: glycosyltransferase family 4 protein [Candidatus Levybacteria bacterium]|nr:glycosyltransferase family 4 protein [Candidatus Levybacteria bacterium]
MKSPSIVYLIWDTKNSGGNKVVFEHVNGLKKRDYDVKIITVFGKYPKWFPLAVKIKKLTILDIISKTDILVATFWPTVWLANFMKAKRKFYFVQGWEENLYKNIILRKIAKLTHRFPLKKIVISKYIETKIREYISNNSLVIFRLPGCAIDTSIFKPPSHKKNKTGNKTLILSVISWYQWYKGTDLLNKAVQELKKSHPEYLFTLVSCEKKPYSAIFDHFISNPTPSTLARLYQESDALLLTSRSEGFPLPPLEAMTCRCPVISTRSGGISEYSTHYQNAIILDNITQLWEENIIEKLIHNKKLRNKLIENGYKTSKKYVWEDIVKSLESIFVLNQHYP